MATHQHHGGNERLPAYRVHLHPMSLAGGVTGAAVTLALAVMIVRHNHLDAGVNAWVLAGGAAAACLWLLGPVARFLGFEVRLEGDRILLKTRPFARVRSARLGDVEHVSEHAGMLGRQLGYGTVVLQGRGGTGATLRHVRDPGGLCRALSVRARAFAQRKP